jgi:hypothetical protein
MALDTHYGGIIKVNGSHDTSSMDTSKDLWLRGQLGDMATGSSRAQLCCNIHTKVLLRGSQTLRSEARHMLANQGYVPCRALCTTPLQMKRQHE